MKLVLKKGALSRQIGIPERDNIPVALLNIIVHTPEGVTIQNPTSKGKRLIHVTELLQKRARFALTMKRWHKK